MSKIIVLASFYPKKDKINEAKEIILSMIKPTRSEEGNELYNFYEEKNSDSNCTSFHLFEIHTPKSYPTLGNFFVRKFIKKTIVFYCRRALKNYNFLTAR
mgnify:CR=1 FL=1